MEGLTYEQDVMIGLPWHHFVDIVKFAIDQATDDRSTLSDLLRSPEYDDAYEGPSGLGEGRHGSYLLETVTVDSFEVRNLGAVQSQIHEWLTMATETPDPDPADPESSDLPADPGIESMLDEHVFSTVEAADALYQLVLPESAEGPEWRTGRENGFHEFIAIDRDAGSLTLLVFTDD